MEANTLAKDVVWLGAAQAEAEALRGTLKLQVRALAGAVCKEICILLPPLGSMQLPTEIWHLSRNCPA